MITDSKVKAKINKWEAAGFNLVSNDYAQHDPRVVWSITEAVQEERLARILGSFVLELEKPVNPAKGKTAIKRLAFHTPPKFARDVLFKIEDIDARTLQAISFTTGVHPIDINKLEASDHAVAAALAKVVIDKVESSEAVEV